MHQPDNTTRDMLGRSKNVSLDKALWALQKHIKPFSTDNVIVPIDDGLGRITSHDIKAPEDLPPYPRSTMDGYAVKGSDTFGASTNNPAYMEITGDVKMGDMPLIGPPPGTCFKISTGGLMPPGTDSVVRLEHTVNIDAHMIEIIRGVAPGINVIGTGEDMHKGETQIPQGHRLRPQDLGLLAGLGIKNVSVKQRLRVGIISTGDEIVPFDEKPAPGKIRDMNSVILAGFIRKAGAIPKYYGIVPDKESEFHAAAKTAMEENEIILFSGSSSVGIRDMGVKIIESLGDPGIIVHGVAIKPGKPVIIALCNGKPVFGLPGHPVSATVCFEMLVSPAIKLMEGSFNSFLPEKKIIKGILMRNIPSAGGRKDFVRVKVRKENNNKTFKIDPILGKSGAISTMVKAHGYLVINESIQGLRKGDEVKVELF